MAQLYIALMSDWVAPPAMYASAAFVSFWKVGDATAAAATFAAAAAAEAAAAFAVAINFVKLVSTFAWSGDTYLSAQDVVSRPLVFVAASMNWRCMGVVGNAFFFGLSNRNLGYSGLVGLRLM